MEKSVPVLIAGSGPSGLYLALALRKYGIQVRVIEKDTTFHVGSRGSGIYPRTMELMGLLGVLDDVQRNACDIPLIRSYTPGPPEQAKVLNTWPFVEIVEATPARPYGITRSINQNIHEGVIREHLKEFGCEVEMGTELIDFDQDDEGVNVKVRRLQGQDGTAQEETIRASYLVGADGARGIVRKLLKLAFLGKTEDADAIAVADVLTKDLSTDYIHFWEQRKGDGSVTIFTRPLDPYQKENPCFQMLILGNYTDEEMRRFGLDQDVFQDEFRKISGRTDVRIDSVLWQSYFRPNMRMVDKFGEGRVFVVGDAAHVHSPTGGQGLNSSVHDSINLSWKLALVLKELAPASLLNTYSEERLPVIAEMLRKTSGLYAQSQDEAKSTDKDKENAAWRRGGALYMLDINYRWSSIVLEGRDPNLGDEEKRLSLLTEMKSHSYGGYQTGLCAGDRAPESPGLIFPQPSKASGKPGDKTSLFKLFSFLKHTIIIFAPSSKHDAVKEILFATAGISKDSVQVIVITPMGVDDAVEGAKQEGVDIELLDRDGHAHEGYFVKKGELNVVIVRPDGYVGAIIKDKAGVGKYFEQIFVR